MVDDAPYDPRAVANLLVSLARQNGRSLSNLALQKLLYFAHALFLVETKQPLLKGYFEAWKYGPVHPVVYQAFKGAGDRPIDFMARGVDLGTGAETELPAPTSPDVYRVLNRIFAAYGGMTPGRLVEVTHAKNAPWDFVVNKNKTGVAFGQRIPDNVIVERFKHHKVPVAPYPIAGEPSEDTPPS